MSNVKATSIKERDEVRTLNVGDIVIFNNFRVEVVEIICAMGGDMCISGIVKSWHYEHHIDVKYGERVFWGPKGVAKDLYEYIFKNFHKVKD